jgi:hypothetical protein
VYVLRKTQGPALAAESLGDIDLVLLSHDYHFDNLDHAGRRLLGTAAPHCRSGGDHGRGRRSSGRSGHRPGAVGKRRGART